MQKNNDCYMFTTIRKNDSADINEFIESWSKSYAYPKMEMYTNAIAKQLLVAKDLEGLFEWKNKMILSDKKAKVFEKKILRKIELVNALKQEWNETVFEKEFSLLSSIWKIFLMHIIQPNQFPIFDQHVYRAFKFIAEQKPDASLPLYDKAKFTIYRRDYLPFYRNCAKEMDGRFTSKNLDDALWTFGKFLKNYSKLFVQWSNSDKNVQECDATDAQ